MLMVRSLMLQVLSPARWRAICVARLSQREAKHGACGVQTLMGVLPHHSSLVRPASYHSMMVEWPVLVPQDYS